ncbi:hypothetical protein ACIA6T_34510 [Streptomyces sp. NPDC051740]|uniref:hypothetical protein n=1 Tax=Streptomyces sp. NPDC051740 TaxID=3365673 RepID=UPI00378A0B70
MAVAVPAGRPRSWDTPRPGRLVEVRPYRTGRLSTRAALPRVGMGPILATDAPPGRNTELLTDTAHEVCTIWAAQATSEGP